MEGRTTAPGYHLSANANGKGQYMARFFKFAALCALWLAPGSWLLADETAGQNKTEKTAGKYVRISRDRQGQAMALETAVVRLAAPGSPTGATVDLVGAVHVADRAYYRKLNERFDDYDVVLYELVAEPGTRIPRGGKREVDNPLALVQQIMKMVLDLDLQTEQIDYTRTNFVHADLSPQQMAEAIRQRGDTGLTLFLSIAADLLRQQNLQEIKQSSKKQQADDDIDPLSALLAPDGAAKLKRLMAEQMETFLSPDGGLGQTLGTILIADRNKAAIKALQKELAKGKKKIAIFYGAAHMPDMEKRLREELGLKRQHEEWLTAWDLQKERGLDGLLRLLEP
jgi:hypothetical protein